MPTARDIFGLTRTAWIWRPSGAKRKRAQVRAAQAQKTTTWKTSRVVKLTPPTSCGSIEIQISGSLEIRAWTISWISAWPAIVAPNEATKTASSALEPALAATGR